MYKYEPMLCKASVIEDLTTLPILNQVKSNIFPFLEVGHSDIDIDLSIMKKLTETFGRAFEDYPPLRKHLQKWRIHLGIYLKVRILEYGYQKQTESKITE